MLNKTKVVLAAALMLGTASAALANDSGENDMGGYVLPGNTDGVNPAYHPRWFPNYRRASTRDTAGAAYGFVPAVKQTHRTSHKRTQDR
jgi:hypothetical protein